MQASELRMILRCYSRLASKYYSMSGFQPRHSAVLGDAAEKREDPELGEERKEGLSFASTASATHCFTD